MFLKTSHAWAPSATFSSYLYSFYLLWCFTFSSDVQTDCIKYLFLKVDAGFKKELRDHSKYFILRSSRGSREFIWTAGAGQKLRKICIWTSDLLSVKWRILRLNLPRIILTKCGSESEFGLFSLCRIIYPWHVGCSWKPLCILSTCWCLEEMTTSE